MKAQFLFPRFFRYIGYLLALPGFVLGYFVVYQKYQIAALSFEIRKQRTLLLSTTENFTNELALTLVIAGLLFIAFSKIKKEDELTGKIRLNALYWAILTNFCGFAIFMALSFINFLFKIEPITQLLNAINSGDAFLIYNFYTPLVIFIGRFNYLIYRNKADCKVPEIHLLKHAPYNIIGKGLSLIIIGIITFNLVFTQNNTVDNIYWVLPLTLLLWVYAKEKNEDEYINALRLDAMQIAVYTNYIILLLSNFFFYGIDFLMIQIINFVTIPLIFQIRFQYLLFYLRRQDARNKLNLSCL
ncbi:hypothetical protein [Mucilaginibacter boryungensis]|uniref:Uncharacterized protein n=1 Tax=Mucilaginibacter boryungensis TaxID=768480 RepID=A0ABR9XCV4_9SPHI|nr:hypothetical protein [Mucilaginibacter boryungensis]MBE9665066.1 hypothetical protein [Mucilaginibacter boryungensis]